MSDSDKRKQQTSTPSKVTGGESFSHGGIEKRGSARDGDRTPISSQDSRFSKSNDKSK